LSVAREPTFSCRLLGEIAMLASAAAATVSVCVAFVYPEAVAVSTGLPAFVSS